MTRAVTIVSDENNPNNRRILVDGAQWMKVYGFDQEQVEERAQLIASLLSSDSGVRKKSRKFKDQRAQNAYDLFFSNGWMRGDIERFYRSGFMNVARPDEPGSPREAVWLAGRDRAEAGLPHGIPDRPEFRALLAAMAEQENGK